MVNCPICNKALSSRKTLYRHIKKVHGIDPWEFRVKAKSVFG
jgi:uncharacterized C2H2 Zn-finger protein